MTHIITEISVAQAATLIFTVITFVQYTLSLSIVILLIHLMPKVNTAISWSSISRTIHSSLWPTILRTDSNSGKTSSRMVSAISSLILITSILVAITGIILPLGLKDGPLVPGNYRLVDTKFVSDESPLKLATTPYRDQFVHGRVCGFNETLPCPGNGNDRNTSKIAPSLVDIFNSTPHGPFSMQFRLFADGGTHFDCSLGALGTAQTFIQSNTMFVTEGVVVDMSEEHPGIGLWNQTVPVDGGTWSQDILWLEPVTECVNTNLTIDYVVENDPNSPIDEFNLTDHGGFVHLTHDLQAPSELRGGQRDIGLVQRAYKAAVYSNVAAMESLNITPESSTKGKTYPLSRAVSGDLDSVGQTVYAPLSYLNGTTAAMMELETLCSGYAMTDAVDVRTVHVRCGIFLGPPLRADGGEERILNPGSRWKQDLYACSSATRASVQRLTFSTNVTSSLQNIQVSRQMNLTVLWGMEKVNMKIQDLDPLWSRVDEKYENDSTLWTIRSDRFYLPAGSTSFSDLAIVPPGSAFATHAAVWGSIFSTTSFKPMGFTDYSAQSNYAMKTKYQVLVRVHPGVGHAQIRNLIWTDIMANNVIGTQQSSTLLAAPNKESIAYDFKYAIPGFILLLVWIPSFFMVAFLFLTRSLTFKYMKNVLNHTSIGRIVVGSSGLRVQKYWEGHPGVPEAGTNRSVMSSSVSESATDVTGGGSGEKDSRVRRRRRSDWANTMGRSQVVLELDESEKLMASGV